MRAILLFCVLVAALVSFPAPVSTSYVDPPRAKPSPRPHPHGHRNYAPPDYPWPYPKYDDKGNRPPRPKPSSWYVKRADDDHSSEARSLEEQNVVWSDGAKGGLTWGLEDRCPAPLSACPVRGVPDADAYECVDLLSDLDSCGGCAADDIAFDCNAIPHARGVECVSGFCEVRSCMEGYVVVPTRDMCVRQ